MTHLVTAAQMKSYDKYTIEKMGVPSMVLMEHAAMACVEEFYKGGGSGSSRHDASSGSSRWEFDKEKVLCVCSAGNNGGDGFAVARLLHLDGVNVEILFIGSRKKCSNETTQQFAICENYGINIHINDVEIIASGGYTSVVDAIFGIGLDREVEGKYAEAISNINRLSGSDQVLNKVAGCNAVRVLSCDIPSGLNADTGQVMGVAVKAAMTVTFAYNKVGLTIGEGPKYSGEVIVKDIGIYAPDDL